MFLILIFTLIFLQINDVHSKLFNSKSFDLSNGLKVVVVENNRAPVVSSMIWYNVGSIDEDYGKSGVAHFLEHLMFKGTSKFPGNYFSNYISKNGGTENAFTSFDYTAYYQIVPSENIEKIIELEADRMKNLTISKKQIATEKNVILEERNQRIDSDPSSMLDESMRKSLFSNHTYGRPIIGWRHEIENLTYEDVFQFYKEYYRPSNATLILSGDITLQESKKLVKKYFGKIKPNKEKLKRNYLIDPPINAKILLDLKHPNVSQKIWKRIYKTNSITSSITNAMALDIGLDIIAGGRNSFLYKKLVNEKKIVSAVGGYFQGLSKGPGLIYFYAIPNEDVKVSVIEKQIREIFEFAVKGGITEEIFLAKKKEYYYDSIYQRDGITKPAQIIGEALSIGLKLNEVEKWDSYLDDLSLSDVYLALEKFLENDEYVTGILR